MAGRRNSKCGRREHEGATALRRGAAPHASHSHSCKIAMSDFEIPLLVISGPGKAVPHCNFRARSALPLRRSGNVPANLSAQIVSVADPS